jgi:hypothetical protein
MPEQAPVMMAVFVGIDEDMLSEWYKEGGVESFG